MSNVFTVTDAEYPQIAEGQIPLSQWDMWVDSGERIQMTAKCNENEEPVDFTHRFEWIQNKVTQWFGTSVRFVKVSMVRIDQDKVCVRGMLVSAI